MRVLVTGAAGFVGANLAGRLLRQGHDVNVTCRPGGDHWRLSLLAGVTVHELDLAAPGAAGALVDALAPHWLFHLAAYGAYSWQTDAGRICDTNLRATVELADSAERCGVRAFVHAGSSSEYGFKDHPAREQERPDPNSAYAVTKAAATMYCSHRAREGDLPAVTLRLYSVYGDLEDSRRLIATLMREGRAKRFPPLVAPETARDFVYVEDVCDALLRAAEGAGALAGEIYNVGSGRQTTLRDVVGCVREIFDIEEEPRWSSHAQRRWDTDRWCADVAKAAGGLGWRARTDLRSGLLRILEQQRARECPRDTAGP